jgi:desulfoferrodoxin (superoxide reductase-like protein)
MFLKSAVASSVAAGLAGTAAAAERHFPTKVDMSLFEGINRVKDPASKTPLEKSHAPVIVAPKSVKAGEAFTVEVSVGEKLHDMGPVHWIEYIELNLGNEPAGRASAPFRPAAWVSSWSMRACRRRSGLSAPSTSRRPSRRWNSLTTYP